MPAPSIDYLNARRAHKPASGGKTQSRAVKYAPDAQGFRCLDGLEYLKLWVERKRAVTNMANDEIVF